MIESGVGGPFRGPPCNQSAMVTVLVSNAITSLAAMVPSASAPDVVKAMKTVSAPADNEGQASAKKSDVVVAAAHVGMEVPAEKRGNVAGDAEAQRTVRADEPWVANATASPRGQPRPGPAAAGSSTPT